MHLKDVIEKNLLLASLAGASFLSFVPGPPKALDGPGYSLQRVSASFQISGNHGSHSRRNRGHWRAHVPQEFELNKNVPYLFSGNAFLIGKICP